MKGAAPTAGAVGLTRSHMAMALPIPSPARCMSATVEDCWPPSSVKSGCTRAAVCHAASNEGEPPAESGKPESEEESTEGALAADASSLAYASVAPASGESGALLLENS